MLKSVIFIFPGCVVKIEDVEEMQDILENVIIVDPSTNFGNHRLCKQIMSK